MGYFTVGVILIGFTYGCIGQFIEARRVRKSQRGPGFKRMLFVHYLCCACYLGFLVSYLLNVFIAWKGFERGGLTGTNTDLSCLVFLAMLLIIKFAVMPKLGKQYKLDKI